MTQIESDAPSIGRDLLRAFIIYAYTVNGSIFCLANRGTGMQSIGKKLKTFFFISLNTALYIIYSRNVQLYYAFRDIYLCTVQNFIRHFSLDFLLDYSLLPSGDGR